jgi:hypothetical protein
MPVQPPAGIDRIGACSPVPSPGDFAHGRATTRPRLIPAKLKAGAPDRRLLDLRRWNVVAIHATARLRQDLRKYL